MNVLICTYGADGIRRVADMNLPTVDGVTYIISWQQPGDTALPAALRRSDIAVHRSDTTGLSVNRNLALSLATDEVCLIADDDLHYTARNLIDVMQVFDSNPDVDVAAFMSHSEVVGKIYPERPCALSDMPRGYYITSVEMAVRRRPDRQLPAFDTRFGIGSKLFGCGEEEIFVHNALKKGLVCKFFPIFACSYTGIPTGERMVDDPSVLMAFGAVLAIRHPLTAAPRIALKSWRLRRSSGISVLKSLRLMTRGAIISLKTKL